MCNFKNIPTTIFALINLWRLGTPSQLEMDTHFKDNSWDSSVLYDPLQLVNSYEKISDYAHIEENAMLFWIIYKYDGLFMIYHIVAYF